MGVVSELNRASLILNIAALVILFGVIRYTAIYRQRARLDDKLYFGMSLMVSVIAACDGVLCITRGRTELATVNLLILTVFYMMMQASSGLLGLFFVQRISGGLEKDEKKTFLLYIPAIIGMALVISSIFTGAIFFVDPVTGLPAMGEWYVLIPVVPVFYTVVSSIMIFKKDPRAILLVILMIALRIFQGLCRRGVSGLAIWLAVGLVYIHLHNMRDPYYEEEEL